MLNLSVIFLSRAGQKYMVSMLQCVTIVVYGSSFVCVFIGEKLFTEQNLFYVACFITEFVWRVLFVCFFVFLYVKTNV